MQPEGAYLIEHPSMSNSGRSHSGQSIDTNIRLHTGQPEILREILEILCLIPSFLPIKGKIDPKSILTPP